MSQKTVGGPKAGLKLPSQTSQDPRLGRLGSLFEHLSRREKDLISARAKNKDFPIRNGLGESLPKLPKYLDHPPPPYFHRVIVGRGLPVEYRQSEDGAHYLKDGIYYFRPLNPSHPANQDSKSASNT